MESYNLPKNFFQGFKLSDYGKGYLLKPPDNNKDIGIKYYYNAWWIVSSNAWFLKKEFKDFFINNGASYIPNKKKVIVLDNLNGFEISRVKCMCGQCPTNSICKYPPHDGWYLKYNHNLFKKNRKNDSEDYNEAIFIPVIFGAKKNNSKKIWWISPSLGIKKFIESGAIFNKVKMKNIQN